MFVFACRLEHPFTQYQNKWTRLGEQEFQTLKVIDLISMFLSSIDQIPMVPYMRACSNAVFYTRHTYVR